MTDNGTERRGDQTETRPGGRGPDPRLFGLLAIVLAIGLAVLLAYIMVTLNHADQCLAMGGRNCG